MHDPHARITLIAHEATKPDLDWNYAASGRMSVAFLESVRSLRYALTAAVTEVGLDVCRAIVDRAGRADEFLDLLTDLPEAFTGDVLLIRDDGAGILSATARGGDRVLYALTVDDVRFYLEAHDLVTGRVALGRTA
jgi:hypothetical protein